MPLFLTIGSNLAMGVISIITCTTTISNIIKGSTSFGESISSLLISFIMLISMLLIPIFTMRWRIKNEKERERKRQTYYRNYIKNKNDELEKLKRARREELENNYPLIR